MEITITTENGQRKLNYNEIDCYRGISKIDNFNCVIYLKNGECIFCIETFDQIDLILNF